jgi:hypothetical protein
LIRWLAHHTARLIEAADQARAANALDADARAAEAREAILQLWRARSDWPSGWPPPLAVEIARTLDELPSLNAHKWYRHTPLARLHDIHHHVLAVLTDLAVHDASVDIEQGWLAAYGDHLTEHEVTMLRRAAEKPRRLDALLRWNDLYELLDMHPSGESAHDADVVAEDIETHPLVKLADAYHAAVVSLVRPVRSTASIVAGAVPDDESQGPETATSEEPPNGSDSEVKKS